MSDDEYDDELPQISFNSSFTRDSQELLRMPTAEELAIQRAREVECERELQALRASDTEVCLNTDDSSGSEGEAALAAAVTALHVKAGARTCPSSLADLLTPTLSRLPQDYMPLALLESLREATPATLAALTEDVCEATVTGQLEGREEVTCAAAWLCVASVGAATRDLRRRSRRALLAVFEHGHFADTDGEASRVLLDAVIGSGLDASLCLELADAVAAAASAARLQQRLLLAALAALLGCDPPQPESEEWCGCAWAAPAVAGAWARLEAGAAAACVRAAGRAVRACVCTSVQPAQCAAPRARLLRALAAAPPRAARAEPERLDVRPTCTLLR